MRIVGYSTALICRICECETNENNLKSDQNVWILKILRAFANITVNKLSVSADTSSEFSLRTFSCFSFTYR